MSSNVARLGRAVLARRDELDLSQLDVAAAGGPSDTTLSRIENGLATSVSKITLRRLDAALAWNSGSARRVYTGTGDPTPLEPGTITVGPDARPPTSATDVPVGAGVEPGVLADLTDDETAKVLDYVAMLKAARKD